jgi:mevalonate kinase
MNNHYYYGHGKLLLTGEYFVLDGAKALALPTRMGQKMNVSYKRSNSPKLFWKGVDVNNNIWFEASFELWHFNLLDNTSDEAVVLQKILRQARKQNIHFLREDMDVFVETGLEFPIGWGLGSSSTLLYNIAQWAYISPFELQDKIFNGSGYDIACAQSMGPIIYSKNSNGPTWKSVTFSPLFKDKIYFIYLNKKQNSRDGIKHYHETSSENKIQIIKKINELTKRFHKAIDLKEFEDCIYEHEELIAQELKMDRVKELYFANYWGAVKSLGAWGGDFVLVTSDRSEAETKEYFNNLGFSTFLTYSEMITESLDVNTLLQNNKENFSKNNVTTH